MRRNVEMVLCIDIKMVMISNRFLILTFYCRGRTKWWLYRWTNKWSMFRYTGRVWCFIKVFV